jgi:PhnB protein
MSDPKTEYEFPTLTPYIVVKGADAAIEFYQKAFGAEVIEVMRGEDGKVMNAQLKFGTSVLMLNDEYPEYGSFAPAKDVPLPFSIHIRSFAVDADFQKAIDAGAIVAMPLENQFWGDRFGMLTDPFGHKWSLGQPVSELS